MAASHGVGTAVGAHLVGGLKAPDAETAMRTAGQILGCHLRAVTDGETGERNQWIGWQLGKLTSVDGIELVGTKDQAAPDNPEYSDFPALAVDPSVTELPLARSGTRTRPSRPTRSSSGCAVRGRSRPG